MPVSKGRSWATDQPYKAASFPLSHGQRRAGLEEGQEVEGVQLTDLELDFITGA